MTTLPASSGRALRILPLRLKLLSANLSLDGFTGQLWRSGLGLALNRHFPGVFELLFSEQAKLGRLYALKPPFEPIRPGATFEFGLTLFGPATEHALACTQAIAMLGEMGLGEARGRFSVIEAAGEGAEPFLRRDGGLLHWPTAQPASHWLTESTPASQVRIELRTPLRIKEHNEQCFAPLPFGQFVRRLQGRLAQLAEAAGEANPLEAGQAAGQRAEAEAVELRHSALDWQEISRRSARTQQKMDFGGMTGALTYGGNLTPFSGLLALAEVVQLGGKTAFGFGCVSNDFVPGHGTESSIQVCG